MLKIEPGDGGRLLVRFPYSPELVEKIKTIPGRRWHPELKAWSVPAGEGMVERLRELFAEQMAIDVSNTVLKKVGEELSLGGYSSKTCTIAAVFTADQERSNDCNGGRYPEIPALPDR